nr:MAG TPA: hypothetical protein [Caudoviricetes sp.]
MKYILLYKVRLRAITNNTDAITQKRVGKYK